MRRADARGAQRQPLFEARHRERVGVLRSRAPCWHEPVAVGVGLDDGDDPGAPGAGADDSEVVAQGLGVDDGPDQPAHRKTPSA